MRSSWAPAGDEAAERDCGVREQSAGIEEINKAIVQMENTTQQNAALVEQASASTHSFEEDSRRLIEVVGKFRLDSEAEASPAHLFVDDRPLLRADNGVCLAFSAGLIPCRRAGRRSETMRNA
jgi:hypothetical protein